MRVAVLIDGGHLRVLARKANKKYDPDFIEKIAYSCVIEPEVLLRILYYDCAPFAGEVKLPISGEAHKFEGSDLWLRRLSERDLFAVRRGILKFRGFKPKYIPVGSRKLTDEDFKPDFEQKGVDMRIGLDIANYASTRAVDRLILITGDTDCLPAMKHARIAGLQIALVEFPKTHLSAELLAHSDFRRAIQWPG